MQRKSGKIKEDYRKRNISILGFSNENKQNKTQTKISKIKRLKSIMTLILKCTSHDYSLFK